MAALSDLLVKISNMIEKLTENMLSHRARISHLEERISKMEQNNAARS